jgi:ABC-2 type transport system ATP-binding protein
LIVDVQGLTKVYEGKQRVVAVDGINLSVEKGELFGLLGPNGAGKTTTISICTTRARATSGSVKISGVDVAAEPSRARLNIGVVPQYNTLYYHCKYFGFSTADAKARSTQLLDQFHLGERTKSYPNQLSGGLQQRVQIARAIAHRPAVLFLDEPSAGLDPQSRIAMWEAVKALRQEGITVVLTTHYMEEADELCERVAIVDHGKVLALDSPANLKKDLGAATVIGLKLRDVAGAATLVATLGSDPLVTAVEPTPEGLRIFAKAMDGLLPRLLEAAQPYGLRDISVSETSLETVFIRLTGRDLRE